MSWPNQLCDQIILHVLTRRNFLVFVAYWLFGALLIGSLGLVWSGQHKQSHSLCKELEGKAVLNWTNSFFSAASAKELSSIFFAGTDDKNPSIRFAVAAFFGSDWLNKQPKNLSLLTD